MTRPHPIQPLELDERGVLRFKANAIVRYLLDNGGIDMNALAREDFSREDREQFAQLIGYSHSGSGDLSYVSDEVWYAAQTEYETRTDAESPAGTARGSEEVMQIGSDDAGQQSPVARGADSEAAPLSAGVMFMMIRQDEEKRAAAHEADLRKFNRTCTRPTCRAEMRPGLRCSSPHCGLKE